MMMRTFRDIFPPSVVAFISDRSTDFTCLEGLEPSQRVVLGELLQGSLEYLCTIRQIHGSEVVLAGKNVPGKKTLQEADGIITREKNLPIAIRTADCLPVFLYDDQQQAIGLVHCGWRGTQKRILSRAINLMRMNFNTASFSIKVAFGPAIRSCHYEVGPEFRAFFKRNIIERDGKMYFDLVRENAEQLMEEGIPEKNIFDCQECSFCDTNYFSYRREGSAAGRMISVMMIK